jgi:hypothetical protein
MGGGQALLGRADSKQAPHRQAQVGRHRAAELALGQVLAAAQGRPSQPAAVQRVGKSAFAVFAARSEQPLPLLLPVAALARRRVWRCCALNRSRHASCRWRPVSGSWRASAWCVN